MRAIILSILLLSAFIPLAHAASDCEHTCCRTYSGSWDDDFDDCRSPKTGFDTCVSDCEAQVWANRPQGPGPASPENTYNCKYPAILAMIGVGALLIERKN
jgi:hypothetical protein